MADDVADDIVIVKLDTVGQHEKAKRADCPIQVTVN